MSYRRYVIVWGNDGNEGRDGYDRRNGRDRERDARGMNAMHDRERDVNNLSDTRNRERDVNNLSDMVMNTFLDILKSRRFKYDNLSDNRTRAKHLTSQNDFKRRNYNTRMNSEDNPFIDAFTRVNNECDTNTNTKADTNNATINAIDAIISSLIDRDVKDNANHATNHTSIPQHNTKADTKRNPHCNPFTDHETDTTPPDTHSDDSYLPPSSDAEFISSCEHYIAQQFNHKNIFALRHKLRTYLENNIDIDVFNDFKRLVHILDSCERSEESKDFVTNLILKYRNL